MYLSKGIQATTVELGMLYKIDQKDANTGSHSG